MASQRTKGVDSARRVLEILLQFSQSKPELTVDEILEVHGISLPSAYRYLSLLREMYLIEERSKGSYVLSPEILQLAQAAERTLDYRVEAQPVLDRLAASTGETALYLRQLNDAAVCLAISESDHAISISFQPGHVMPLHAGAGAKVLLAGFTKARRAQYLDRLDPPLEPAARERLDNELTALRDSRFAVSEGEVDEGLWACAAPVYARGQLIGTVSVVAPAYRVGEEARESIGASVRADAKELEAILADVR
ncbi:MAG: IclR family transcriptional regulator [Microbacteriaceae bacterium]|jgi:DNA-binding IclR family transcriptional regulator|nr:IclR family transcriptional regulator [Microbacteriaceae bacterium]